MSFGTSFPRKNHLETKEVNYDVLNFLTTRWGKPVNAVQHLVDKMNYITDFLNEEKETSKRNMLLGYLKSRQFKAECMYFLNLTTTMAKLIDSVQATKIYPKCYSNINDMKALLIQISEAPIEYFTDIKEECKPKEKEWIEIGDIGRLAIHHALKKYEHIDQMMVYWKRRNAFNTAFAPCDKISQDIMGHCDALTLMMQWCTYKKNYQEKKAEKIVPWRFWTDNETDLPELAQIAKKWLCVIQSSATKERFFGHMRAMEKKYRCRMKGKLYEYEIFLRCNKHILEKYAKEVVIAINSMK